MLRPKKPEEIEIMKQGGEILAVILRKLSALVKPNLTTFDLEQTARKLIKEAGVESSFLDYRGFPAVLCVSVNEVIVHGVPSQGVVLKEGDLVGLDLGIKYKGFYLDAALTVGVGKILKEASQLIKVVREALYLAIGVVRAGSTTGDIGEVIQKHIESNGLKTIRELVGHGVGYAVHEEPQIPNFGRAGQGIVLTENTVIAIEPMATYGSGRIKLAPDGFGYQTSDGTLAAHFEATVAITKKGGKVLTPIL